MYICQDFPDAEAWDTCKRHLTFICKYHMSVGSLYSKGQISRNGRTDLMEKSSISSLRQTITQLLRGSWQSHLSKAHSDHHSVIDFYFGFSSFLFPSSRSLFLLCNVGSFINYVHTSLYVSLCFLAVSMLSKQKFNFSPPRCLHWIWIAIIMSIII